MRFLQCLLLSSFLLCVRCYYQSLIHLDPDINEKNPATLTCPVQEHYDLAASDSNPTISWEYHKFSENATVLSIKTLSINITSVDKAGIYVCKLGDTTRANFSVTYFNPPTIQDVLMRNPNLSVALSKPLASNENARQSVTYNDGDLNKKLTCVSSKSYPPAKFVWKLKREDEDLYHIIDEKNLTNINITNYPDSSVIFFYNLTYDMQAYYQCYAENVGGNGTVQVLIRVKDKLAALWPFLGIVGEVSLLITIIFIYEKKSKKKADLGARYVTGDADKPLNSEANDEDVDNKVRNRVSNNNHKE